MFYVRRGVRWHRRDPQQGTLGTPALSTTLVEYREIIGRHSREQILLLCCTHHGWEINILSLVKRDNGRFLKNKSEVWFALTRIIDPKVTSKDPRVLRLAFCPTITIHLPVYSLSGTMVLWSDRSFRPSFFCHDISSKINRRRHCLDCQKTWEGHRIYSNAATRKNWIQRRDGGTSRYH